MSAHYKPGRYFGRIKSQGLGQSKENKTPFFAFTFDLIGQVDLSNPDGNLIACSPGERTVWIYLTDKTIDFAMRDLALLGYTKTSFRYLDPDAEGFFDLTGREVEVFCNHEDYKGEAREKWGIFRGSAALTIDPLDKGEVKKLDNLFGKHLKQLAAQAVAEQVNKPAPARQPETVPPQDGPDFGGVEDDDTIPF